MTIVPQQLPQPSELGYRIITRALELATIDNIRVFPVHGLRSVGDPAELICSCGNAACPNPGKHPVGSLVPNGHNNATTDRQTVETWFRVRGEIPGWVPWNLGIATGRGLVVIDADVKQSRSDQPTGLQVLDDWEVWTQGTEIPKTLRIRTGSGGVHLWLKVDPELRIKSRNRVLPGVDVKADGGYVLAAPSVHILGEYTVAADHPVAEVPQELRAWLLTVKGGRYISRRVADSAHGAMPDEYDFQTIIRGDGCPAGHRDYFINDLCFRLRKSGISLEDAAAAVRREWRRMEKPSGDDFPWETCLYKLRRVWDEVEPQDVTDIPAWRPGPGLSLGSTSRSETAVEREFPQVAGTSNADGERVRVQVDEPQLNAVDLLNRRDLTFLLSDTGNGIRFAQRMRDTVRYATGEGRWYLWDGNRWVQDQLNRALLLTEEIIQDMYQEAIGLNGDARADLERWALGTQSMARREAMLRGASVQPGIAIAPDDLDTDPWLLVVRNGTLDLKTGLLRESIPQDLNTRQANVTVDARSECPLWLKHIEFVTRGDVKLADYLRRAVGYTLTGLTGEQKLFFLWGTGQNGKSTFVDVLSKMLGSYATTGDENLLTGTGAHPTQLADLRGARLIVQDETDRDKKLAEQRIKMMTGRTIKARYMRQDFFTYTPRFKLWVSGNHKPEIRGNDDGIWRRLKLVPFEAKFSDDQRILDYDEILVQELPGILNWALAGLADWVKLGGLGDTELVTRATKEYREEEDSIGQWLEECCALGIPGSATPAGQLYESYRWWCHANGDQDVRSSTALGRDLAARGLKKELTRWDGKVARVWYGVQLISTSVTG